MKKGDLAKAVANSTGISETRAVEAISAVFSEIENELVNGGDVNISNFGTFKVTHRPGRTGRNPQTGATIEIGPSVSASFKPSAALKKNLSSK